MPASFPNRSQTGTETQQKTTLMRYERSCFVTVPSPSMIIVNVWKSFLIVKAIKDRGQRIEKLE